VQNYSNTTYKWFVTNRSFFNAEKKEYDFLKIMLSLSLK